MILYMEGRNNFNSVGVTVVGSDAPSDYHVAPRTENSTPATGSVPTGTPQVVVPIVPPPAAAAPGMIPVEAMKKKRGRPKKYGPDGEVTMALSPNPISSYAPPPVIDFSAGKRAKIRPVGSASKHQHHKVEAENLGEWVSCSVGANFTPHIINVNAGEDVTMKVISFSQQGPRAICILSANGVISSVTLRQPDSSGGTLTYEGRFEILSLTGSFMPAETGGMRNRSGGMSVSLASPDGRVLGGGVAGLLVAAGPVQMVVGSFLAANQHEQKPKKQKTYTPVAMPTPTAAVPISSVEMVETYGSNGHNTTSAANTKPPPLPNLSSSASFHGDNWSSLPQDARNKQPTTTHDINVTLLA